MRSWSVIAVSASAAFAACEHSTGPSPGPSHEGLSLVWEDGAEVRSTGAPTFAGDDIRGVEFAVAFPDSVGGLVVAGFRPTDGTRGDLFVLQLVEGRAGEFGPCRPSQDCHGRLLEGLDPEDAGVVPDYWEVTDGAVTVDLYAGGRLSGSLEGVALTGPGDGEAVRSIDRGAFDVPMLSDEEGAEIMRCFLKRLTGGECG